MVRNYYVRRDVDRVKDRLNPRAGVQTSCPFQYNSNIAAATGRDAGLHTIPTPTVCYSVTSIVEVSGGCQTVNVYVCLRQRGITIVTLFASFIHKIHRSRNQALRDPWIPAQTRDP